MSALETGRSVHLIPLACSVGIAKMPEYKMGTSDRLRGRWRDVVGDFNARSHCAVPLFIQKRHKRRHCRGTVIKCVVSTVYLRLNAQEVEVSLIEHDPSGNI